MVVVTTFKLKTQSHKQFGRYCKFTCVDETKSECACLIHDDV